MRSIDDLLNKQLVVFTGKGGIGKSLVTAAFGQLAAESGLSTLIVERSEKDQLSPLFGIENVGHKEVEVAENLSCINLDGTICFEEYVVKQLGQKKLFEKVFSNNVVKTFFNTIPGLSEAMILGRLYYTCELANPQKYDIVVFDAPASGHMYNLMTTPDAIIDSGIGGPLVREVSRVKEFLSDPKKCGSIVVTVPEELVSTESLEFIPKLQEDSPIFLDGVLVNKSAPEYEEKQIEEFENFVQSDGKYVIAAKFALKKYKKMLKTQNDFLEQFKLLSDSSDNLALGLLPDLGIVKEPLPKGFGKTFFSKVK